MNSTATESNSPYFHQNLWRWWTIFFCKAWNDPCGYRSSMKWVLQQY